MRDKLHIRVLLWEKVRESALSILPIVVIVALLCLFISPLPSGLLLSFLVGALLITIGIALFNIGAEASMTPIGNRVGTTLTKSRKLALILTVTFLLGFAITVAEPDLQVLASTLSHIYNDIGSILLLVVVGVGVGLFLAVCMLRIILGVRLKWLLMGFYAIVFVLACFAEESFLSVAFDSGGVTTGPMTVPFILALGVGIANIRSDKRAASDSFGLVALCSIGPILAVLILGFFFSGSGGTIDLVATELSSTADVGKAYLVAIPKVLLETAVALLPIVALFLLFQVISFKLQKRSFLKICVGLLYTYVGLVLFLTGVNVGFSSLGTVLGAELASGWTKYLLIPIATLLGWFIISAEPAVAILEKQIEGVTSGAISGRAIKLSLSIAIAVAMALSMLRAQVGIPIMWFLVPGYVIALTLTLFVPDIFTAIAFDSGGVASGPMTATFMLQFVMGVAAASGQDVLEDAFGIVALVALMPLLTIQILGVVYKQKLKRVKKPEEVYGDCDVIELWG